MSIIVGSTRVFFDVDGQEHRKTLTNAGPDILYYGDQTVTTGSFVGSVASGGQVEFPVGRWVVSAGQSRVEYREKLAPALSRYTLTAQDYGAVGDGVGDETATTNRMIADAPTGGRFYYPRGTYNLGAVFPNKSHITGDGYNTVLQPSVGQTTPVIEVTGGSAEDWFTISNVRINCGFDMPYTTPLVKLMSSRGVKLEHVFVTMSGTGTAFLIANAYLTSLDTCHFRTGTFGVPFEVAQTPVGQTIDTFAFTNLVMNGTMGPIFRGPPVALTTSLSGAATKGDTVLQVALAGQLGVGMALTIGAENFTTTAVVGNVVTLSGALANSYANGTTVTIAAVTGGNTHGVSARGFKRVYAGTSLTNADWSAVRYTGALGAGAAAGATSITAATGTGVKFNPGDPVKLDDTVNQDWATVASRIGDVLTLGTVDRTRQPVALIAGNAHVADTTLLMQTGMGKRFFAGDQVTISDGTHAETFTLAVDGNATTDIVTLPAGLANAYAAAGAWLVAWSAFTLANTYANGTTVYNQSLNESTVVSSTTNTITVQPGEGQYFTAGRPVCYSVGARFGANKITAVNTDTLTLQWPITYPPNVADPVIQNGYGSSWNGADEVVMDAVHLEGPPIGFINRGGNNWRLSGIHSCAEAVRSYSSLTDPILGPWTVFGNHNGDVNINLRVPEGNWPNPIRPVLKPMQSVFGTLGPFQPYWGPPNVKYEIHDVTQPVGTGQLYRTIRNFIADGASNVDDIQRFEQYRLNGKDAWSTFGSGKFRYAADPTGSAPYVWGEVGAGSVKQVVAFTSGSPEGVVTGRRGSIAFALGGTAGFNLAYVKLTDTGNTGWLSLPTIRSATASRTPGTIAAGATWPGTTITVTGATVGQPARMDVDGTALATGLIPYARVTATDTVTPYIYNSTAGGVTVNSGGAVNVRVIVDAT